MTSSRRWFAGALLSFSFLLTCGGNAFGLPAFARKYGLRCSACHEAWPKLNDFGWRFKDNGYQLMNDRDAPIWQNPSYWPVTFRITPNWHRDTTSKVAVDTGIDPVTGIPSGSAEQRVTASGFDITGLDFHTGGTLEKNFSFYVLPSSDSSGNFHFETVMARLDNLFGSPWLNIKLGKFELDNMISEKRILTISNNGGFYNIYHFSPVNDTNGYGQIGDNQLGLEWMGHSFNDRTRVSASLISSTDGSPNIPSGNAYSGFFAASQAFDAGGLGLQRVGAYAFVGEAPTYFLTGGGVAGVNPGSAVNGAGYKGFSREGVFALLYVNKFDFSLFYQHGSDSKYFRPEVALAQSDSASVLPLGTRSPSWNGGFIEAHYTANPQFIIIQRSEWIRVSQQAVPGTPSNLGNIDAYTVGYRWYPIMTSRAGFAWHNEYSWFRQGASAPISGRDLSSGTLMAGFDFDF